MTNLRTKLVVAAALVASIAVGGPIAVSVAAQRPLTDAAVVAAQPVPNAQFHPLSATSVSIGLDFYVPPRDPAALKAFIASVSTPGSRSFHRYLAKGQFAARFGATTQTIASITKYLASHGLRSITTSHDRLFVRASGSIRAVDALLHTTIHEYAYKGKRVYSNVTSARLPKALAGRVAAVVGLSDVPQYKASYVVHPQRPHATTTCSQMTQGTNATAGPFTISQMGANYKYGAFASQGDNGQGQTLAVFELTDYLPADIRYYQSCIGGAHDTIAGIRVDGGGGVDLSAEVEADLDIEIPATLAPKANIDVYEGPNSQAGVVDTYQRIATDDTAQVTTTSWGL